jgi:OOP family OmpA-OmpF porin
MQYRSTHALVLSTLLCTCTNIVWAENAPIPINNSDFGQASTPVNAPQNNTLTPTDAATIGTVISGASASVPVLASNNYGMANKNSTQGFKPFQSFNPSSGMQTKLYGGASIGSSKLHDLCSGSNDTACKDKDMTWKLYGGYRINDLITVQGSYVDLGELGIDNNPSKLKGFSASILSPMKINDQLSIFGKAGFFKWESKNRQGNKVSDIDPVFGIGVDYQFNQNLAVRGELAHYKDLAVSSSDNIAKDFDILSVGIKYSTF